MERRSSRFGDAATGRDEPRKGAGIYGLCAMRDFVRKLDATIVRLGVVTGRELSGRTALTLDFAERRSVRSVARAPGEHRLTRTLQQTKKMLHPGCARQKKNAKARTRD